MNSFNEPRIRKQGFFDCIVRRKYSRKRASPVATRHLRASTKVTDASQSNVPVVPCSAFFGPTTQFRGRSKARGDRSVSTLTISTGDHVPVLSACTMDVLARRNLTRSDLHSKQRVSEPATIPHRITKTWLSASQMDQNDQVLADEDRTGRFFNPRSRQRAA